MEYKEKFNWGKCFHAWEPGRGGRRRLVPLQLPAWEIRKADHPFRKCYDSSQQVEEGPERARTQLCASQHRAPWTWPANVSIIAHFSVSQQCWACGTLTNPPWRVLQIPSEQHVLSLWLGSPIACSNVCVCERSIWNFSPACCSHICTFWKGN